MFRASSGKTAGGRLLIGAGLLALLAPAIAGCEAGNNAPTLEYHAASAGGQYSFNGMKISDPFVLGAPAGSTVPAGSSASFFLSIYNGTTSADKLISVSAPGIASSVIVSGGTVALPAGTAVNLTGPQPALVLKNLLKPLSGGSNISVKLDFQRAGSVTLQVSVEPRSFYWSTYSPPPAAAIASPSTVTPPTGNASATPTARG